MQPIYTWIEEKARRRLAVADGRSSAAWVGEQREDEADEASCRPGRLSTGSIAQAAHTFRLCRHLALRDVDIHLLTTRRAVTKGLPFNIHLITRDLAGSAAFRDIYESVLASRSPEDLHRSHLQRPSMTTLGSTIYKFASDGYAWISFRTVVPRRVRVLTNDVEPYAIVATFPVKKIGGAVHAI